MLSHREGNSESPASIKDVATRSWLRSASLVPRRNNALLNVPGAFCLVGSRSNSTVGNLMAELGHHIVNGLTFSLCTGVLTDHFPCSFFFISTALLPRTFFVYTVWTYCIDSWSGTNYRLAQGEVVHHTVCGGRLFYFPRIGAKKGSQSAPR